MRQFQESKAAGTHLSPPGASAAQFCIAIYGGYFGGGIGMLTLARLPVRRAGATMYVLASVMKRVGSGHFRRLA